MMDRPERVLVKRIMDGDCKEVETIAHMIGIKKCYFDNKLYRSSFSFRDLVKIATIKGYTIKFVREDDEIVIDPSEFIDELYIDDYISNKQESIKALEHQLKSLKDDMDYIKSINV